MAASRQAAHSTSSPFAFGSAEYATADHQRNLESLVADFCALFPAYPVIKLRVGPDEAYVAPTESLIHDGNTEGGSRLDIDLMVRGHFRHAASE